MNIMQLILLGDDGHGHSHGGNVNMRGVYLHVMGDMVGSIVVMLSAGLTAWYNNCLSFASDHCEAHNDAIACGDFLIEKAHNGSVNAISVNGNQLTETTLGMMFPENKNPWIEYVDPVTSIILTMLIVFTTLKTVRGKLLVDWLKLKLLLDPIMTLLQTVPENVNLNKIENDLVRIAKEEHQTDIKVHNLHVWKLSADKIIGTVHIKIRTHYDQATQVEKFQQVRDNLMVEINSV